MKKNHKHTCEHCGHIITYEPKKNWNGDLRCPMCSKMTHVNQIGDYID